MYKLSLKARGNLTVVVARYLVVYCVLFQVFGSDKRYAIACHLNLGLV